MKVKFSASRYPFLLMLFLAVLFLNQCSTRKNTPITRTYHNLTSYYNILFNGRESYEKGVDSYHEAYQYDFTRILPVFINGNPGLSEQIKPQMERTIEKCSKLIRLHSISAKPKNLEKKRELTKEEKVYYEKNEFNEYVDDAYLLMGKAYFREMKYQTASRVLQYAAREFKSQKIRDEANIWLARCYIELQQPREAEKILTKLEEKEGTIDANHQGMFYATSADLYMSRQQYEQAIPYLEKSVQVQKSKDIKSRHAFIIAQLYEETGQPEQALRKYARLIDMNPDYKLEFNARLKQAWLHQLTDRSSGEMKQELEKMLRDEKNDDYFDQVHYALGKIALQNEKTDEAIEHLKKSARQSISNENQKGLSFLSLADIYFENKKYQVAQAYYDSAVTTLESSYPGYTDLYVKTRHLTDLVSNLNTIERQDSLQKVAQMSDSERNALISRLINEHQEEQRRQAEAGQQQYSQRMPANRNRNRESVSSWYFYSQTAVRQGQSEFQRRWGNRKLEDNWRLSNKNTADFGDFEETTPQGEEQQEKKQLSKTNRSYYLQDLPISDSAMEASDKKIQEAWYQVANIYMNDLENTPKAIEAFENLNQRFPNNPYKPGTYYYLYKLNRETGNTDEANRYKERIIRRYPESNYAKVLNNPDYFRELEQAKNRMERMYAQTLQLYKQGQYQRVMDSCNRALENFNETSYLARFEYLKALSVGQTSDIVTFRNSLQKVTDQYPDTEVAREANNTLSYLKKTELRQISQKFAQNKPGKKNGRSKQQPPDSRPKPRADTIYSLEKDIPYYFMVITETQNTDLGRLKFDLINFNLDFFLQKDYTTSSQPFNEFFTAITIKRFEDYESAQKYYNLLSKKEERVFKQEGMENYRYFFISVKNYVTLLDRKSIIEYINFFNEHIL
ncbi:MAG TPA: tetratricopeptide repeat protein [Bacteroidales bacterium]|nr:tetratricopeptide repeat protein [Bacteroidales bacterium]